MSTTSARIDAGLASRRRIGVARGSTGGFAVAVAVSAVVGAASATGTGRIAIVGVAALCMLSGFAVLYRRNAPAAVVAVWLLQVFQAPIAAAVGYNSGAGHAVRECTDGLVVVLILLTLSRPRAVERSAAAARAMPVLWCIIGGISFAGFASDLGHSVPVSVSILGWWLAIKIWVLMLITMSLPWKFSHIEKIYRLLLAVGALASLAAIIDYLGHGVVASALHVNLTSTVSGSYRSNAVQGFFINPGECSLFLSYMVGIALASYAERRRRSDLAYLALFVLGTILALRLKGVLSMAAVVAVVVFLRTPHRRSGTLKLVGLAAILGLIVFYTEATVISTQINSYTGRQSESTARGHLYTGGFQLGADNFPLGVGFGRYGSDAARRHYSPIYYTLGFEQVWGLSPQMDLFLDDTSWPAVIGETGYLGLLVVVSGFAWLALIAIREARRTDGRQGWWGVVAACTLVVTLVNSLGTPALFDWLAAFTLAIIYGPMMADSERPAVERAPVTVLEEAR